MKGREIDALIEQKIFNREIVWGAEPYIVDSWDTGTPTRRVIGSYTVETKAATGEPLRFIGCLVPSRSTDIAAAWKVYEWLESRGLVSVSNGDGDSKDCTFLPYSKPFAPQYLNSAEVSAEAYPLAICLAALKAVGVEISEAGATGESEEG